MFWAGGTGSAKALGQHWHGMFAEHWGGPGAEVPEGRRQEERSGVGQARAGGVALTLSTVRSLAHGERPEGATPPCPPLPLPWEGWAWREWGPSRGNH